MPILRYTSFDLVTFKVFLVTVYTLGRTTSGNKNIKKAKKLRKETSRSTSENVFEDHRHINAKAGLDLQVHSQQPTTIGEEHRN